MLRAIGGVVSGKALIAVAAWGASFIATRVALEAFNPFSLIAVRLLIGVALLFLMLQLRGGLLLPNRRDLPRCVFLGVILGAHLLIQAHGLQYTTAINTGWIVGFMPVTIALAAHALRKQRLSRRGWMGVAFATLGVWLVTSAQLRDFREARFGDLLQLSTCITWTLFTLAGAGPVARNGALRVTAFATAVATFVSLVPTVSCGLTRGAVTMGTVAAVAFLGLVCSGLAFALWLRAQREHGPTRVGAMLYFEPFFTLALAVPTLGEPVTAKTILGGLGVFGGVWLVGKGVKRVNVLAAKPGW